MAAAVKGWQALLAAIRQVTGGERGLLYDVPQEQAPVSIDGARVHVRGGDAWWQFIERRRLLDDGLLTPIVSLRPLQREERWLVTGWGSRFGNAFVLIEPHDPGCDLTAVMNSRRGSLLRSAATGEAGALAAALRAAYGIWHAADGPVAVHAGGAGETLMDAVLASLRRRYPMQAFTGALVELLRDEPELFSGRPAARAVLPFLTRRGLPVAHDPSLVVEAVRQLVNRGVVRVSAAGVSYRGPARPVPESVSGDAFAALVLA